ncbi:hypothetical protein [Cognatiyoonia sp. IB215182]|nr:hypothetical protein [Cognatiyoonia sp. IB215182]MDX8355750.1 hypothetical protein [Cognatiyoonia sp. IB215182]
MIGIRDFTAFTGACCLVVAALAGSMANADIEKGLTVLYTGDVTTAAEF